MTATPTIAIATPAGRKVITLDAGGSVIFVGANGSGKTRLAVHIETELGLRAHRISAHRALSMNPSVPKISETEARLGLKTGMASREAIHDHRAGSRWGHRQAVSLLNDFDLLLQTLFADQANRALATHVRCRAGDTRPPDETHLERLQGIWESLNPHRKLQITGDDIRVFPIDGSASYDAAQLSDGERALFYVIGQVLCAEQSSVLIFDEPELHIHRAIMSKLWDQLEAARADCAFVLITHDLDFSASRVGQKYIVRDFVFPARWTIDDVPVESEFDESLMTKILGSRKPILFVEGRNNSLDFAVFRNCYHQYTVIPRNSCEEVIHAVVTFRANPALTRITCAGLVDADARSSNEVASLAAAGISVLPVCEIENLFLLPEIARAIGRTEALEDPELTTKVDAMNAEVLQSAKNGTNIEAAVARYCRRRIDSSLKTIDLSDQESISDISARYSALTSALNIAQMAAERRTAIQKYITDVDMASFLAVYDNKGLLAIVAKHMKATRLTSFESWLVRMLGSKETSHLRTAVLSQLPVIVTS